MEKRVLFIFLLIMYSGCTGVVDHLARQELSGGYIYHESAGQPFIEKKHSSKGIPGWIFKYDFNNEFIVALEKDIELSREEREKLITNGDFYEFMLQNGDSRFWIICHSNDSIYGPLSEEAYTLKREDLRVPKELDFKNN